MAPLVKKKREDLPWSDMWRIAFARTSSTPALRSRKIPSMYARMPHVHAYLARGTYANDLMRLDDFVNSIMDSQEHLPKKERIFRKSHVPFSKSRVVKKDWARVIQLVQECVLSAHTRATDIHIEQEMMDKKGGADLIVHYKRGNVLGIGSYTDEDEASMTVRFTLVYTDGSVYESYLFVANGTLYATQLIPVPEGVEIATLDKREWPGIGDVSSTEFFTLDESYTRFVGNFLLSHKDDDLHGRFWIDSSDTVREIDERLAPCSEEGSENPIMETVSPSSLFIANYGGLETVVLSLFFVFITAIAWQPGVGWTIIPLLLALASFFLMGKILFNILNSTLDTDLMVNKQKPSESLWRLSHVFKVFCACASAAFMSLGAAFLTLRLEDKEPSDLSFETFTTLYPIAALCAVAVWTLLAKRVKSPINLNPVSDEQANFSLLVDILTGVLLMCVAVFLHINAVEQQWLSLSLFSFGIAVAFPILAKIPMLVLGGLSPLRTIGQSCYNKYVHSDAGLTRAMFAEKYMVQP